MSLSSTTNRINYTGNGSVSVYAYTFRIFSEDDLTVTVRDTNNNETTLTKTTDYTVDGVGVGSGGNVTLVNASQAWLTSGNLTTGYVITIRRVLDVTQPTDIRNQGTFYPEAHENAFDRACMINQQQQDEVDRSFKLPETVDPSTFDTKLPVGILTPGSFLQTNAAGNGMTAIDALSDSEIAIEAGTGIVVRTSTSNALLRTLTGTANEITVTNGDGVSGNPTLSLPSTFLSSKISGSTEVTADQDDYVVINDTSDSNSTKKALVGRLKDENVTSLNSTDSPYTVLATEDVILVDAISDDVTLNLPATAGVQGKKYKIKRIDQSYTLNVTFTDGDVTTGTDNINVSSHGFVDLQKVQVSNSGGALPTGLSTSTDYWLIYVDADNFKLASSRANAVADTAVDITAASGGGTHTLEYQHNQIIIDPSSSETVDGSTTVELWAQNDYRVIVADGSVGWYEVGGYIEPVNFRATRNSAQSLGTAADVIYDDLDRDTHAGYDASTGIFTTPRDDYYTISGGIGVTNSVSAAQSNSIFIGVAGAAMFQDIIHGSATSSKYTLNAHGSIFIAAGTQVKMRFQSNASSTSDTSLYENYFTITTASRK